MRPRRCGNSRYGTLETTSSSCRTRLKHPYKHPYGIAPCDPPRLKRAQSTQTGPPDTGIPRIRYAVPLLASKPRFVLRIGFLAVPSRRFDPFVDPLPDPRSSRRVACWPADRANPIFAGLL